MDDYTLEKLIELIGKTNDDNHFNKYSEEVAAGRGTGYLATKDLLEVSEITEALEELRTGHPADEVYFGDDAKPEGYIIEKLDALIRNLNTFYEISKEHDLPLEEIVRYLILKVEYNARRADTARSGQKLF